MLWMRRVGAPPWLLVGWWTMVYGGPRPPGAVRAFASSRRARRPAWTLSLSSPRPRPSAGPPRAGSGRIVMKQVLSRVRIIGPLPFRYSSSPLFLRPSHPFSLFFLLYFLFAHLTSLRIVSILPPHHHASTVVCLHVCIESRCPLAPHRRIFECMITCLCHAIKCHAPKNMNKNLKHIDCRATELRYRRVH